MSRAPIPTAIRRGLVASTWEGAFAQVFITLTGGFFLLEFARRLGADDLALGLLASLPFLAQTAQVATGWVYERAGARRRGITAWTLLVARLLWLLPVAIALGWAPEPARLPAYLAVVALSALLHTAGAHGWISWMGDLVPPSVRGRYFGFRAAVCAVSALAAAYGAGLVLDALDAIGPGSGFAVLYAVAAAAGVLAFVAIRRQHHPRPRRVEQHAPWPVLWREIWAKPEHRRVFAFFFLWNVGLGLSVPFWTDYMRRVLGMASWQIGLQNTIGGVVGVFFVLAWGRTVDRVGSRPVLLANAFCIACIPFLWLFAAPGTTWPVWLDAVVTGVFWPGFNLTALNVPLSLAAPRGGAVFLGVFSAITGLALGLSSIAAGGIAHAIGPGPHRLLGGDYAVHQVMFALSGVMRAVALPLALRLPDPRAKRMVFLFQVMGYAVRHRLNLGRQILTAPWRRRA